MTHMSKLRLGIVGCGRVAEQCHIPAALSARDAELVAVAESSDSRLSYIVRSFGLSCFATTSRADLLGRVDAVLLPLPNHLHYSVANEFLNAGVHVLCEKPLANTAREAVLLCETAEARDLILAVGYMKRFEPNSELMKRLIDERFLGRLDRFAFSYGTPGGWAPVSGYNLHREQAGGGVLTTSGCHLLDRMLDWFGYPSEVTYQDDVDGGVEANCCAVFGFDSGLIGQLRLSKTVALPSRFRLDGERGCLEINGAEHSTVSFSPAAQPGLRHEIRRFQSPSRSPTSIISDCRSTTSPRAIRDKGRPRVSGRAGLASVKLTEECYRVRSPLPQPWVFDSLPRLRVNGGRQLGSAGPGGSDAGDRRRRSPHLR